MADNYLEKQYESYLARKAAWEKAKKYGIRKPRPSAKAADNTPEPTDTHEKPRR